MTANRKFLTVITVFFLFFVTLSQNSFAIIYKWEDFTQPYNKQFTVQLVITVEVDLPDFILNNFREIPLVIEHSGLGYHPTGSRYSGILTINEQDQSQGYRFGYKRYTDEPIRLLINTKELKTGLNKLLFRRTSDIQWANFDIYKLYFDLQDIEKIRTITSKSTSTSDIDEKKPQSLPPKVHEDITSPKIIITSHDTSRGIRPVENQKKVTIRGKAFDENGIVEITVNNKDAVFDEAGNFEADVHLKLGENQIVVSAMDVYENWASKEFTITRVAAKAPPGTKFSKTAIGEYYALVIGNNNYKFLRNLKTARKDAQEIIGILKVRFGFKTTLLLDASRNAIIRSFNNFRKKLGANDHFLIYYAGHGEFDKSANKAYWLPVNAQSDDDTNWIIVDTITSNIRRIVSKHVIVVSDSCYSGTLTRRAVSDFDSSEKRNIYLQKMLSKKSRTLMASGGNEPVSDFGGEGHSIFAKAFLFGLKNIDAKKFTAEELYIQYIKEMVAGSSEQTPEYNIIRNSGHEGGDFVFRRTN